MSSGKFKVGDQVIIVGRYTSGSYTFMNDRDYWLENKTILTISGINEFNGNYYIEAIDKDNNGNWCFYSVDLKLYKRPELIVGEQELDV